MESRQESSTRSSPTLSQPSESQMHSPPKKNRPFKSIFDYILEGTSSEDSSCVVDRWSMTLRETEPKSEARACESPREEFWTPSETQSRVQVYSSAPRFLQDLCTTERDSTSAVCSDDVPLFYLGSPQASADSVNGDTTRDDAPLPMISFVAPDSTDQATSKLGGRFNSPLRKSKKTYPITNVSTIAIGQITEEGIHPLRIRGSISKFKTFRGASSLKRDRIATSLDEACSAVSPAKHTHQNFHHPVALGGFISSDAIIPDRQPWLIKSSNAKKIPNLGISIRRACTIFLLLLSALILGRRVESWNGGSVPSSELDIWVGNATGSSLPSPSFGRNDSLCHNELGQTPQTNEEPRNANISLFTQPLMEEKPRHHVVPSPKWRPKLQSIWKWILERKSRAKSRVAPGARIRIRTIWRIRNILRYWKQKWRCVRSCMMCTSR